MWFPFAYLPFLLFIPILLVLGIFFVIVPGGFIIVLAGAYYASLEVLGLLGLAARRRRRAVRANRRRAQGGLALVTPRPPGSQLARPVALTRDLRPRPELASVSRVTQHMPHGRETNTISRGPLASSRALTDGPPTSRAHRN
jgi:hypothetical protein